MCSIGICVSSLSGMDKLGDLMFSLNTVCIVCEDNSFIPGTHNTFFLAILWGRWGGQLGIPNGKVE